MKTIVYHSRRRILDLINQLDDSFINYLRMRQSLIAAIAGILFILMGIILQQYTLSIAVILSGAIGYLIGFTPAILVTLLMITLNTFNTPGIHFSTVIVQIFGTIMIAWLGRKHRLEVRKQLCLESKDNEKHVISWTFVNEVRNSLLAMRLLLFQKSPDNVKDTNLKIIEDELLRLESLFGKIHDKDTKP